MVASWTIRNARWPTKLWPEHGLGHLGDDGRRPGLIGHRVGLVGQPRDAGDQGAEDAAHHDQGRAGVESLRTVKCADPVGDCLQAGQRRAAVGERLEEHEDPQCREDAVAGADRHRAWDMRGVVRQVAEDLPDHAADDDEQHRPGEEVGREGERAAGLPQTAKVAVEQQKDDGHRDGQRDVVVVQGRHGGGDGRRTGCCLDGHGDDVVDHQGDRADLGHDRPEVLAGDDVGPAGVGVDHHDRAVGQRDQDQHREDDTGHRQQQPVGREPERRE